MVLDILEYSFLMLQNFILRITSNICCVNVLTSSLLFNLFLVERYDLGSFWKDISNCVIDILI